MSERGNFFHEWHVAINRHSRPQDGDRPDWSTMRFMYEAKTAAQEVPRLARLFKLEREGGLPKTHRHCSHSPLEAVPENHLTCCLGVKCTKCAFLKALDGAELSPEQIDEAKAWTCATHIIGEGGDTMREGYILTVDDRMFWDRTYASMAQTDCPADAVSGGADK